MVMPENRVGLLLNLPVETCAILLSGTDCKIIPVTI